MSVDTFIGINDLDPEAVAERLASVKQQGIRIGFAIESGTRAWGFPSPVSDYDCRFVYICPVAHHIGLVSHRDVIEFPITSNDRYSSFAERIELNQEADARAQHLADIFYQQEVRRAVG